MKRLLISIVLVSAMFSVSAMAQSAKFAASWDNDDVTAFANAPGASPGFNAEVEMATIHIAQHKSVLIGVSAQIGIHLITIAKGKSDGDVEGTAKAEGSVDVLVTLVNQDGGNNCTVAPGPIVFKSEMRELKVSATATEGEIEVTVGIDTDSVSANHFNFLGVECDQGTYKMMADFGLDAIASASGVDSSSEVTVTLGSRMITMQEVRAVKGSLVVDPS